MARRLTDQPSPSPSVFDLPDQPTSSFAVCMKLRLSLLVDVELFWRSSPPTPTPWSSGLRAGGSCGAVRPLRFRISSSLLIFSFLHRYRVLSPGSSPTDLQQVDHEAREDGPSPTSSTSVCAQRPVRLWKTAKSRGSYHVRGDCCRSRSRGEVSLPFAEATKLTIPLLQFR